MTTKNELSRGDFFSPKEIMQHVSRIRQHFSIDEMPPFRIVATTPNYSKYKCRKAYFTSLNGLIDFIDLSNSNIKDLCAKFRVFMNTQIANRGDKPENWITKEDIQTADNFLNALEANFENK